MGRGRTSTESTIPDELGGDTEGTGDTEEDGVEVHLVKTVVGQEDTRVSVDVGPGVLGLASLLFKKIKYHAKKGIQWILSYLKKDVRDDVVDLADELEEGVFGEMLQSKLALGRVTGICLTQDGVTIARDDLTTLEGRPNVLLDGLVASTYADLRLHLAQPEENLLVCETVERTGETVQGSTEGEEGVREGGADEFAGVSRDIATFMITDRR